MKTKGVKIMSKIQRAIVSHVKLIGFVCLCMCDNVCSMDREIKRYLDGFCIYSILYVLLLEMVRCSSCTDLVSWVVLENDWLAVEYF